VSNASDDDLFSTGENWDPVGRPATDMDDGLAGEVQTVPISPSIAATAAELASSFPGDTADRLIYATAVERGWQLVTKDGRLRRHKHPRRITVW